MRCSSATSSAVRHASRGEGSRVASSSSSAARRAARSARRVSQPRTGAQKLRCHAPNGRTSRLSAGSGSRPGSSRSSQEAVDEPVTRAGLGEQVPRARRVRLELAAQLRHVDVQVVRLVAVRRPPHLAQDRAVRQQLALRCWASSAQDAELVRRQVDAPRPSTVTDCLLEVDADRPDLDHRLARRPGAAQRPRAGARAARRSRTAS